MSKRMEKFGIHSRDTRDSRDSKDSRDSRDTRDSRDSRDRRDKRRYRNRSRSRSRNKYHRSRSLSPRASSSSQTNTSSSSSRNLTTNGMPKQAPGKKNLKYIPCNHVSKQTLRNVYEWLTDVKCPHENDCWYSHSYQEWKAALYKKPCLSLKPDGSCDKLHCKFDHEIKVAVNPTLDESVRSASPLVVDEKQKDSKVEQAAVEALPAIPETSESKDASHPVIQAMLCKPCFYLQADGTCKFGAACRYSHDLSLFTPPPSVNDAGVAFPTMFMPPYDMPQDQFLLHMGDEEEEDAVDNENGGEQQVQEIDIDVVGWDLFAQQNYHNNVNVSFSIQASSPDELLRIIEQVQLLSNNSASISVDEVVNA